MMESVAATFKSGLPANLAGASQSTTLSPPQPKARRGDVLASSGSLDVFLIDDRPLIRDCLGRSMLALEPNLSLTYLSRAEEFEKLAPERAGASCVVLVSITTSHGVAATLPQIARIKNVSPGTKVVVLSETESIEDILHVFENGASAYIPPSVGLEVAVKVMQLVAAGGSYVPMSILAGCCDPSREQVGATKLQDPSGNAFTSKQIAVMEALRRGKANKIIAYELNMCESTVKVHVRNVMKKLRAKNRTEAAFLINESALGH